MTKFNAAGSAYIFSTYFGGNKNDYASAIALDSQRHPYFVGLAHSDNLPTTLGAFQTTFGGGGDGYVAMLSDLALPIAGLSTNSLNCGDVGVGFTSTAQTVTLTNQGDAAMTISGVVASGDFAQTNDCGTGVAAGTSGSISITFTPTVVGSRTGAITITDSATGSPHVISLIGDGLPAPAVLLSPGSLTFSAQIVGTPSTAQTLTLTNNGTGVLNITSITASGNFAPTNTCGTSVAAGANCAINVTFTPTAAGARTGTLTITDNASGSPHTVALSGTGTTAPVVSFSPTSLTFRHNINIDCPPKTVTLTNGGTAPLTITSIVTSGPFTQTNTCGPSLAVGASCDISVIFQPTAEGTVTGALSIADNATGSPHVVPLTGTGTPPCVLTTPLHTARLVRGTGSAQFTISDPAPSCHSAPIALACLRTGAASCAFSPATIPPMGSSELTVGNLTALTSDTLNFTVTGTSGRDTTAVNLTVLLSDFSFTTYPHSAMVTAGQKASYALSLVPTNRLTGNIQLSCQGAPAGATCKLSPSVVKLDGLTPVQATMTVTTTARSMVPPGGQGRWRVPPGISQPVALPWLPALWALAMLAALSAVAAAAAYLPRQDHRLRLSKLMLAATMLALLVWAACGGGGGFVSNPASTGTPPGTYSLTVTATYTGTPGTSASLTHSTTFTLKVN